MKYKSAISGILAKFDVIVIFIDWADEAVEKAEILRLIYQGRFLHSNVTLGALGLVPARTTVMHLVPRETLPEPNSQGEKQNLTGYCFLLFPLLIHILNL